ncbi:MAG: site-specific DNA-methyltransferase [Candidatus Lokiarchaeota archaeon]|nr:site-specific DNA-methyltransferase [Candidatus Lokiarchaeota archaeon]
MPKSEVYNCNCMDTDRGLPSYFDNYFDLAVVDPPYGIKGHKQRVFNDGKEWDNNIPKSSYFYELKRVSKNYIVWGGNYFSDVWPCKNFIVWDKRQPQGLTFAMIEIAATSFDKPAELYFTQPAGRRGFYTVDEKRIHPTQKPLKLYNWILRKYAKKGDLILDTHIGSGSSRIAAYKMGYDFIGYELDSDYFNDMNKRFDKECKNIEVIKGIEYKQQSLF